MDDAELRLCGGSLRDPQEQHNHSSSFLPCQKRHLCVGCRVNVLLICSHLSAHSKGSSSQELLEISAKKGLLTRRTTHGGYPTVAALFSINTRGTRCQLCCRVCPHAWLGAHMGTVTRHWGACRDSLSFGNAGGADSQAPVIHAGLKEKVNPSSFLASPGSLLEEGLDRTRSSAPPLSQVLMQTGVMGQGPSRAEE